MEFHSEFHSVLWNFSTHSTLFHILLFGMIFLFAVYILGF